MIERKHHDEKGIFSIIVQRTWGGAILILGCALFLYWTGKIPLMQPQGQMPVTVWPKTMLIGIIVVMAFKMILNVVVALREVAHDAPVTSPWTGIDYRNLVIVSLLLISVPVMWDLIGFFFANLFFVTAFFLFGGEKLWKAIVYAIGSTLALVYLFVKIVYISLPMGVGQVEDVTRAVYRFLRVF